MNGSRFLISVVLVIGMFMLAGCGGASKHLIVKESLKAGNAISIEYVDWLLTVEFVTGSTPHPEEFESITGTAIDVLKEAYPKATIATIDEQPEYDVLVKLAVRSDYGMHKSKYSLECSSFVTFYKPDESGQRMKIGSGLGYGTGSVVSETFPQSNSLEANMETIPPLTMLEDLKAAFTIGLKAELEKINATE